MNPQHVTTDEGRRLSAAHEHARAAGGTGRFLSFRLSDGGTDGAVYDTWDDARRFGALHADQCGILLVQPGQMPPAEASAWLHLHRRMRDAGLDLTDPDAVNGALLAQRMPTSLAAGLALPRPPANRAQRRAALRGHHHG